MGKILLQKVGSDVEVFLQDKNGKPVPCINIVGGTKEKPLALEGLPDGYAIQEDNVMLEFNIPAAADAFTFAHHVLRAQEAIEAKIKAQDLCMVIAPSMKFDAKQLLHPQAMRAGCEDDFNVWERAVNEKPELHKELRGAGGHVHVSFLIDGNVPKFPQNLTVAENLVMALDVTLGCPLAKLDKDEVRKQFYGKAGAFRVKKYGTKAAGIEYRVPSNYWTQSPAMMGWVFGRVEAAVGLCNAYGDQARATFLTWREHVEGAINTGNPANFAWVARNHRFVMP